ncbi:hypothetical protein HK098_000394 [Nowakowskiella sp. JEL0407]|nr:hypothetical protein HK098_000394 [Nowakowskiella sp. JEL0407]
MVTVTMFPSSIFRSPYVLLLPVLIIVVILTIDLKELPSRAGLKSKFNQLYQDSIITTEGSAFIRMFSQIENIRYKCVDNRPIGGAQGAEGVWQVCFDRMFRLSDNCQVYSFGINNDFTWDDAIQVATGCTVHSFDPTMTMQETERNSKSFFHPIAIGAKDDDNFTGGDKFSIGVQGVNWTVRTLDSMKKMYNTKSIPVLKIDTEYNEWEVLEQWLDAGSLDVVEQLLMEVHFWPQKEDPLMHMQPHRRIGIMNKWSSILEKLAEQGFKLYYVHTNPQSTMVDLGLDLTAKEKAIESSSRVSNSISHPPVKTTHGSTFSKMFSLIQDIQYNCIDNRPVGGVPGAEGVWQVCFDKLTKLPEDCQIYSFGINNDFTFDDAIIQATGCTVHSFDPTMAMEETQRSPKSFFHPIGIGAKNDDSFTGGDKFSMGLAGVNWTVRTMDEMKKMYKSINMPLVKMDTEYNEWEVLEQWLEAGSLSNVDQLVMEVHFWPQKEDPLYFQPHRQLEIMNKWVSILDRLQGQGFKLYNVHLNPMSTMVDLGIGFHFPCCFEVSYVKA